MGTISINTLAAACLWIIHNTYPGDIAVWASVARVLVVAILMIMIVRYGCPHMCSRVCMPVPLTPIGEKHVMMTQLFIWTNGSQPLRSRTFWCAVDARLLALESFGAGHVCRAVPGHVVDFIVDLAIAVP